MDLNKRERENENETSREGVEIEEERRALTLPGERGQESTEIDEIEKSKVAIMRALLQREDTSSQVFFFIL